MNSLSPRALTLLLAGALATGAFACGDDAADDGLPANAADAVTTYSQIVHASYEDSLAAAQELDSAIDSFVASPDETGFAAAQNAWIDSRIPYLQTEVYRFYDGPIDADDGEPEGMINAWPMDEQTVDYVADDASAGRVNDLEFEITTANLAATNAAGGEADVATGFHAIEFLLWGQDLTAPVDNLPGQRAYTDYTTADNADRRGEYLGALSELLVEHLEGLTSAWAPGESNYRQEFEAAPTEESFAKILSGMAVLAVFETGGERLQAALDAQDQEEEHSCFSDTTRTDMIEDIVGIINVWEGRYVRVDGTVVEGTGVDEVIAAYDPALATEITTKLATALAAAEAMQSPFDYEISASNPDGNARVQAVIDALQSLLTPFETIFATFAFEVPSDLQ